MKVKPVALVLILATGPLAAPLAAEAWQHAGKVWRIGVLMLLDASDSDWPQAFRDGLRALGYVEGQGVVIEWRYAQGRADRLPGLAAELVRLKADVIVADRTDAIRAAMQATSTIPIVMALSADAVVSGLVSNLRRPGGNVTGVSIMLTEVSAKRLQLLREAVPTVSRVAVLWNPALPWHHTMVKEIDTVAASLRLQPVLVAVRNPAELEDRAFAAMTSGRVDALLVSETMALPARTKLLDFAAKRRLPAMFNNRDYVRAGGLMSYSPNYLDMFRHAAAYVDKILKGAKPADLPVEQPTRFDLIINLKAAKALGLTIPPSVLVRADEVIQ
jgi:putative ABC transport system substrate-binding protein